MMVCNYSAIEHVALAWWIPFCSCAILQAMVNFRVAFARISKVEPMGITIAKKKILR